MNRRSLIVGFLTLVGLITGVVFHQILLGTIFGMAIGVLVEFVTRSK